ncbi:terminase [Bifidobacterium pullorum]|uniref:terminase n=1 Tax=Bifidobacterium pullorum TaxID=78448 RepID=UPI0027BA9E40|nr:terminase [Bifidobacterium pullorum]
MSEIARHLVQPSGIVGSDFNLVNRAAVKAGIRYDLWQQGFLYLLLAKREDGRYACGAGGAVLSSCRQIGKTFMIGTAMFILCAGRKGTLVIWTAHHTRTSDETFNDLCELARTPVLARYVDHIRRANGQQEIRFSNGSRIMFGARENGFGRGLHSADIEVFDEAQILTVKALDNLIPIVNTSPNPLVVLMGNPPKPGDQSEAFAEKRANALAGSDGMLYVELSADPDADPDDRDQWAKANPSYPRRTGEDAILRMRNLLAEDSFRREALGIWDEIASVHVIDPDVWAGETIEEPDTKGLLAFGVDMPPDRGALCIGYAIRKDDGTALVGVEEYRSTGTQGVAWAVEWLAERWAKTAAVVVDAQSPAMSLLPDLKARHVRVTVTQTRDLGAATGRMLDMIRDRKILHLPDGEQPQLAMAVHGATLRDLGPNGAVAWQKKGSDVDISPLQAVTLALHGAYTTKRRPGRKQKVMI